MMPPQVVVSQGQQQRPNVSCEKATIQKGFFWAYLARPRPKLYRCLSSLLDRLIYIYRQQIVRNLPRFSKAGGFFVVIRKRARAETSGTCGKLLQPIMVTALPKLFLSCPTDEGLGSHTNTRYRSIQLRLYPCHYYYLPLTFNCLSSLNESH